MVTNCQVRDENLQYDINKETARISALLLDKIDENVYFTG